MQLQEESGGAKPEEDNAQHRRRDARAALVGVFRGGLDGNGHGVTDGAFDSLRQPALRRLFAENQAGGGEGQHDHRRDGEDGIEGQGGAEFESPGLVPHQPRLLQQSHDPHTSPSAETAHGQRLLTPRRLLPLVLNSSCAVPQPAVDFPCSA